MNRARLSDDEMVERLKVWEECKRNAATAAKVFGINPSAFRSSIRDAKNRGLSAKTKLQNTEAKLKTQLQLVKQELAETKRHNETVESIRKEIYGLAELTPDPPKWINPKSTKAGSPGTPIVVISDLHWGEKVSRIQVGGCNEYNRKIARERLAKLISKVIDLTINHMVNPTYPGIVCCLGGDMITGAIHDELAETNDGTVQQALLDCQEHLILAITRLADQFGKVFVPCVVGNHGRDTHKPRFKDSVFHSYEWNLYCQLERHFLRDKRVQFFIPGGSDAYFTVNGHRYLLTHGDKLGVAGGDGMIGILGPITRGRIKLGRQQAQVGRDFDTMIVCHYHTYVPRSEASHTIVNGCGIGYNEYAYEKLRAGYSRPTQALWFTHPEYGVTCQWPIYLEKEQKPIRAKKDWVNWDQGSHYDRAA
jgi:transposase-like protein